MIAEPKISINNCSLCGAPSASQEFCCAGCEAVFKILLKRQELDHFHDHPLFLQALKAGLISNPAYHEKKKSHSEEEVQKIYIEIQDMWCPSCGEIIRLILLEEKGVNQCLVDYTTDLASIEFSPKASRRSGYLRSSIR